jgi:hypothetical protein
MPLYTFIHSLLNVLVKIANKMGLHTKSHNDSIMKLNDCQAAKQLQTHHSDCSTCLGPLGTRDRETDVVVPRMSWSTEPLLVWVGSVVHVS